MWNIRWQARGRKKVTRSADVERLLQDLHHRFLKKATPVLVTIETPRNKDSLAIGVGAKESILNYVPGSGEPPYFSSVGDPSAEGTIAFAFMGDWTELPMKTAIPFDLALKGVTYFLQTGRLAPCITWEQD
jgi:hypothetical protein